jgi:aspartyl-tRNA(Asn)/glutamyl-tRNA(Gln) amidotransferase subunit C
VSITREDVLKIAELSKLDFSEAELDAFTSQFQHILDYIEKLKAADVEGVSPTSHVSLVPDFEKHIFRADQVRDSLPPREALANAPDAREDQFRVPKVI